MNWRSWRKVSRLVVLGVTVLTMAAAAILGHHATAARPAATSTVCAHLGSCR